MKSYVVSGLLLFISLMTIGQQREIDSINSIIKDQSLVDQINSLNELSWHYKNFNLDSALIFADKALKLSTETRSKAAISQSLNSLANAFEAKGVLDSALIFHKQSFLIKEELEDSLGMASSLNNLGIVYDELGQYSKSLECYFQALRIYEAKSDKPYDMAMVLGNIGIVYKKQKEYSKVLEYYQQAFSIYEEVQSEFGKTVIQGNIGGVLLLKKDFMEAIRYSQEAMDSYKKLGYARYVPYMLGNIGIAHDSLGDIVKARKIYLEAADLHRQNDNLLELTHLQVVLAANAEKSGDFQQGIVFSTEALKNAREIGAKDFEVSALYELSKNLSGSGRNDLAFSNLLEHNIAKDSLFEESKTKQIYELQTKYETEKKEQQIALQKAEIEQQRILNQRNLTTIFSLTVMVILLSVIIVLVRSRSRKKQTLITQEAEIKLRETQLNATITSQEKERTRFAKDLHDGFGQMISVLNLNLKSLKTGAESNLSVYEESTKVLNEMHVELRAICFNLMPHTLIQSGIVVAIQEFSDRINASGNLYIQTDFYGMEVRLDELVEVSIYRIVQEWVNNIMKHSDADKVTIQLTKDQSEITLLIEDNGSGFDPMLLINGEGNGWKNMNSRVNLVKGDLALDTKPHFRGTTLTLNIPVLITKEKTIAI